MDDLADLPAFLVEAKRRTYAGLDDDATIAAPALPGSKQLEYGAGALRYRDLYFGMVFFTGIETVSRADRVIWSMSYSGGMLPEVKGRELMLGIYAFLRQALLSIEESRPYRGPPAFADGGFTYANTVSGELTRFSGSETIHADGRLVFALHYGGGAIR